MVIPCACVQVLRLKGGALGLFFILTKIKIERNIVSYKGNGRVNKTRKVNEKTIEL